MLPFAEAQYNFWVYICPFTAGFSAKAAVHSLRTAAFNNVAPWGQLTLGVVPVAEQLVEAALEYNDLPSDLSKIVNEIVLTNQREEVKKQKFMEQQFRKLYANN